MMFINAPLSKALSNAKETIAKARRPSYAVQDTQSLKTATSYEVAVQNCSTK